MVPDLTTYDVILVNTSAGKDSQAMTDYVVEHATEQGVLDRVVMVHADLGRMEWSGTKDLAHEHAKHYGLRFEVVKREVVGDLLAEVRRRGKWPSSTERYCTSYYKRDQVQKLITVLGRECVQNDRNVRILNCLGFRAEESPRRKKLNPYEYNERASTKSRDVYNWLPIHSWTVGDVWKRIAEAGTRHHHAYDLGMTRLSCVFCIFAPKGQLMIAAEHNPELFAEYVQMEQEINHSFRVKLPLVDVQNALEAEEEPEADDGCWNM